MRSLPFMEGMMPSRRWEEFANYNECFAAWLEAIDQLCEHFIDVSFYDLVSMSELDPYDAYFGPISTTPEVFFKDAVLPYIESSHGADFIYEHISDNVMWGAWRPGATT